MDFSLFNKKLRKISGIVDATQPPESLSKLEHDLLLSYIRDLYEIATENDDIMIENAIKQTRVNMDVAQPIVEKIDTKPIEKQVETVHVPEPVVTTIAESASVPVAVSSTVNEPLHPKAEYAPSTIIERQIQEPKQEKTPPKLAVKMEDDAKLKELFADEAITDLSDKLSLTHIPDLRKSMGINEKIFTQQELFNNSATLMTETLEVLNNMPSFAEAKTYLVENLIYSQNWLSEQKIKKAATFVKLVKRHFV
ncbi:MAG: hypothetical protein R2774_08560 [Saprospiraceae bacterium]